MAATTDRSIRRVDRACKGSLRGLVPEKRAWVVVEEPLIVEIAQIGAYTLMRTPGDDDALALGFAFSEGFISDPQGVRISRRQREVPDRIRLHLDHTSLSGAPEGRREPINPRKIPLQSGKRQELLRCLPRVGRSLQISLPILQEIMNRMHSRQHLYSLTGATHAAAIFDSQGTMVAFGEDIARHNALDKAIGRWLLDGGIEPGFGVTLSGRISYELVCKSARAGLELVAAISAPSSLAIEAAQRAGITLCAFVRGEEAAVYTHPDRLRWAGPAAPGSMKSLPSGG